MPNFNVNNSRLLVLGAILGGPSNALDISLNPSRCGTDIEYSHNNAGGMGAIVQGTRSTNFFDAAYNEGITFTLDRDFEIQLITQTDRVTGDWRVSANGVVFDYLPQNRPTSGRDLLATGDEVFVPAGEPITFSALAGQVGLFTIRGEIDAGNTSVPEPTAPISFAALALLFLASRRKRNKPNFD